MSSWRAGGQPALVQTVLLARAPACRPGTYTKGPYDFQHAAEMKCDEGTYQPKPGQSACLKCPGRTFQPARGATACRPCRPGNVLDSLKTACTPWQVGPAVQSCMASLAGSARRTCRPAVRAREGRSEELSQCTNSRLHTHRPHLHPAPAAHPARCSRSTRWPAMPATIATSPSGRTCRARQPAAPARLAPQSWTLAASLPLPASPSWQV